MESLEITEFAHKVQRLYSFLLLRYPHDSTNIRHVQAIAKEFHITLHDSE